MVKKQTKKDVKVLESRGLRNRLIDKISRKGQLKSLSNYISKISGTDS